MLIASTMGFGPDTQPMRMPEDRTFEKLSNRTTRPISGSLSSSAK